MKLVNLERGNDIIKQGDGGSMFYVLEAGGCDIFVNGNKVGSYEPGGSFGELALIYNAKRAATIRSTKDCVQHNLKPEMQWPVHRHVSA